MSSKPDTSMICPDRADDHYECGLLSSSNGYRFGEAEKHFRRAIELSENDGNNFILANALIWYASLLVKMKRPHEAVAMYERRLSMMHFDNEDRLERRCTTEHLATLKAELALPGTE